MLSLTSPRHISTLRIGVVSHCVVFARHQSPQATIKASTRLGFGLVDRVKLQNKPEQFGTLADFYKTGATSDGGLSYPLTHVGGELAEGAAAGAGLGGAATMGVGAAAHLAKVPIKGLMNLYERANLGQALRQGSLPLTGRDVGYSMPFNVGEGLKNLALSQASQYGF